MPRRLSLVITLTAWLFAAGSHWDLVQAFAWGRMLATNVQTMPVLAAVKETFSADARCSICKMVSEAKQPRESSDAQAPGTKATEETLLAGAPPHFVLYSPASLHAGVMQPSPALSSASKSTPLLAPPRGC